MHEIIATNGWHLVDRMVNTVFYFIFTDVMYTAADIDIMLLAYIPRIGWECGRQRDVTMER